MNDQEGREDDEKVMVSDKSLDEKNGEGIDSHTKGQEFG